jgi:hypothetical protein
MKWYAIVYQTIGFGSICSAVQTEPGYLFYIDEFLCDSTS